MKNQMSVSIIVFALLVMAALPAYATTIRPNLMVTDFSVDTGSPTVGKDFILTATLQNTEPSACAYRVMASVQAGFPFIMRGVSTEQAADLCKGYITKVDFPLRIDPTATAGFYQLTINTNYDTITNAPFSSSSTINIFVDGSPELDAYVINSEPIDTYPGDTATITVNVENSGSFQAQSVNMMLKADAPLDVKWAKSFSSIGLLEAKQSKTADFAIEVPKDSKAKEYPMTLEVQYLDQDMEQQSKEFSLMFQVKKKALFDTSDAGSDRLFADQTGRNVKLKLTNTGTDTAHNLKAKLLPQFPFSTDGSVRYAEMLEPGKSTEIDMVMDIDKEATPGTYSLDMLVDFEDAQGKDLQDTAKVAFTILPKSFLRVVFMDYWFIWAAAILIILLVVRKKIKSKKKK
jgi:archaellum component FlaG (FlaF/FlaG flagellin family)